MAVRSNDFALQLDLDFETDLALKLGLTQRAVDAARRRAVNKTARWLRTHLLRQLARQENIPQKALKPRMKITLARHGRLSNSAFVWFGSSGINPLSLGLTGRPSGSGYRIGRRYFEGAFRVDRFSALFRRKTSSRLPIERETLEIDETAQEIAKRLSARGNRELEKRLDQELNFEMLKVVA